MKCLKCGSETDNKIDVYSRRNDLAKGWFAIVKNQPSCSTDCSNTIARRERVGGYTVGFKSDSDARVIETWI